MTDFFDLLFIYKYRNIAIKIRIIIIIIKLLKLKHFYLICFFVRVFIAQSFIYQPVTEKIHTIYKEILFQKVLDEMI